MGMDERTFLGISQEEFGGTRYPMTKDMNMVELVARIEESGKRLMKALLESRLEEDPRNNPRDPLCRQCQGPLRIQERAQRRVIKTAIGEMEYRRAYGVCDRCGHTAAPLDEALGIPPSGPSVEAREKICHAAVVGRSFENGHEILEVQARIPLSAKHVRTLAENEGRDLVEQRDQEIGAYRQGQLTVRAAPSPSLMVVAADGGRVQTRQPETEERWKEDKIGIVYDAMARPQPHAKPGEYEGARAQTKTYVATLENWESMGWMLRLEAERRGFAKAKAKVFVADGAQPIRELKNLHFPEATFVLDWAHAAQHLAGCAKAALGEGTPEAEAWYEKHKQWLWDGKTDQIIRNLRRLSEQAGPPRDSDVETSPRRLLYQNAFSYFPNNKEAMAYPAFRAQGWPIGSGVAEGSIKQFGLRMKGSEKFWNGLPRVRTETTGAEEMLALCALYHSEDGRWQHHWRRRAQPR
jgi:hypothetical protein